MKIAEIWKAYEACPMAWKNTSEKRRKAVRTIWNEFACSCWSKPVKSLTSEMVADWLRGRCEGRSDKTYDEYLRIIRQVLNAVLSKTGLRVNPANEVPVRKKNSISRQPYTQDEVNRVLDMIDKGIFIPYKYKTHGKVVVVERPYEIPYPNEIKLTIELGAWCGMRLADAVAVERNMWDGEFLTYTPRKTQTTSGKVVTVPVLHNELKEALEGCDGLLTPNIMRMHERQASDLCRLYERIFRTCGYTVQVQCNGRRNASIGGFHSLRHSYITWAAENGVPIEVVADCVGHTSVITTIIYNHVSKLRKARELAKIMITR